MWNDLRLAARIGGGFAAVLGMMLMVAGTGYWGLQSNTDFATEAIDLGAENAVKALRVEAETCRLRQHEREFLFAVGDQRAEREALDAWRHSRETVVETIGEVAQRTTDAREQADLAEIAKLVDRYAAGFEALIARGERGALAKEELEQAIEPLEELIAEVEQSLEGNASEHEKAMLELDGTIVARANQTERIVMILTILALVLGAVVFVACARSLRDIGRNLQAAVSNLGSSAAQISATAKQTSASSSEQASTVAEVTTTVEEVTQTSKAAAEGAQGVLAASEEAMAGGQRGIESVEGAVEMMNSISERVERVAAKILDLSEKNTQIGDIIETVNDLAEQSNLLAVNASIEAAKAGEQGRGFAVVASEVRTLAEQSKRATQQIRELLTEIRKATESAVMATEEGTKRVEDGRRNVDGVRDVIAELAQVLEGNSDRARQISAASAQQASGMTQISAAMESVSQASRDNAGGAKQLEAAVVQLATLSKQLEAVAGRF
jgi:methyl-accepting chemotaxis protein